MIKYKLIKNYIIFKLNKILLIFLNKVQNIIKIKFSLIVS